MLLEDPEQRCVAHSSHDEGVDWLRRESILGRRTSPALVAWYRGFGISEAKEPIAVPGWPEQGILPRTCAPVRYRDRLLGYIWVIDTTGAICASHKEDLAKAAEHAGILLYEDELAQRLASQTLAHLLSSSEELRLSAAQQVSEQGLLAEGNDCAVVVLEVRSSQHDQPFCQRAAEEALIDLAWEASPRSILRLSCRDHVVLLVCCPDSSDEPAVKLASAGRSAVLRRLGSPCADAQVVAGIGEVGPLKLAHASYRHALQAIRVATAVGGLGDVVRWADLGVFRALAELSITTDLLSLVDPRLRSLLCCRDPSLVETVETYLDLAGDAQAAARALHLHRGTLYYRLSKAERLAGVDLGNGLDRLSLHLGLKLARLAGLLANPGAKTAGRPRHAA